MTSCLGRKFRITETTRTLNGSGLLPWNTVSASPTIPGFTAESGMIVGGGPAGTMARRRVPPLVAETGAARDDPASKSRSAPGDRKKQRAARSLERRGRVRRSQTRRAGTAQKRNPLPAPVPLSRARDHSYRVGAGRTSA